MQAGFNGAGGDAEDRGDVVDGEFFEEVQGQCLALGKGEAIERVMDLLGVVKGEEGAVGRRGFLGFRLGIILVRSEAQAGDGGVAGGGVEEGGQRPRVAQGLDRAEDLEPGFLEQVPGIRFGGSEAAEVVEERALPEVDDGFECAGLATLALRDEDGGLENLFVGMQ